MLKRLRRWMRFRRHDDAYAQTRSMLVGSVMQAVRAQVNAQHAVWLVVHFPDTFLYYQEALDRSGVDYRIAQQVLTPEFLAAAANTDLGAGQVGLVLADLIPDIPLEAVEPAEIVNRRLSVMALERHPLIDHDVRIANFCKRLGARVELGYFQSFEDPLVAREISDMARLVMQQLGLDNHAVINSMVLTRRIDGALKRQRRQYTTDIPADNVEHWYELNASSR